MELGIDVREKIPWIKRWQVIVEHPRNKYREAGEGRITHKTEIIAFPHEPRILLFVTPIIFIDVAVVLRNTIGMKPQSVWRFDCACANAWTLKMKYVQYRLAKRLYNVAGRKVRYIVYTYINDYQIWILVYFAKRCGRKRVTFRRFLPSRIKLSAHGWQNEINYVTVRCHCW